MHNVYSNCFNRTPYCDPVAFSYELIALHLSYLDSKSAVPGSFNRLPIDH